MKSYVHYLEGLYDSMFFDIEGTFPSLRTDCRRDASRLHSLVESRGLSFLMIDLPDAAKHFDMCLTSERLTTFGIAGLRPFRRGGVIPRLFKGLFLRVFDESGVLRSDFDIVAVSYIRQLLLGAKKVKVACDDSRTWKQVQEFFEIERGIRSPSLNWDEDELRIDDIHGLHIGDHDFLSPAPIFDCLDFDKAESSEPLRRSLEPGLYEATQRVADIVSAQLGVFNASEWRTKHGPGAVADQRHTQFKYDFPNWPDKLSKVFPLDEFGFPNYASWAAFVSGIGSWGAYANHEPPSRLISVPKTLKGPRLIAAEPVSHQWCQQAILKFLTERLAETAISKSIHFRDQTFNQRLAKQASHTGSHATIDLSSASDRVSCWLVERIFRKSPSLISAIHASRTRWVVNTLDKLSPTYSKLRKLACMGSAITFPVQSYVFTILVIGVLHYVRGIQPTIRSIRRLSKEVQVFGDDIIIPVDGWELTQGILGDLGLKVNPTKTFVSGKFRESCGLDAFDGHEVTPVYTITYPDVSRPESIMSAVDTHNNFVKKKMYVTAQYIKATVRKERNFSIPRVPIGSGAFGWYDHSWEGNDHLKKRWNPSLQRSEYSVDMPVSKSTRAPTKGDSTLLQYFTEVRPVPYIVGDRLGVVGRASTSIRRRWVPAILIDSSWEAA